MDIKKNQVYTAVVTGITSEGNGIVKINQFAVFVPGTAIGDEIEVKIVKVLKNYGFGILQKLITPSPHRIETDCNVFRQCGGCSFRHISYQAELEIKQQHVEDCFKRLGGIMLSASPIQGDPKPAQYRNKAQFPLGIDQNGNAISGFYANRSHRIVSCTDCKLQPAIFNQILKAVLSFINQYHLPVYQEDTHTGNLRHVYLRQADTTGEIMLCIVTAKKGFKEEKLFVEQITAQFPQIKSIIINVNPQKTNVILGKKCRTIFGKDTISDILCGVQVEISPLAFYQVNKPQAERLYQQALKYAELTKEDTLLDLYCGIGTIGLSAAKQVKSLIGVEIVPQAIENAKQNAVLNGFTNTRFLCDDCKGAVKHLAEEGIHPNVIIVDPPRKGCDSEVLEAIRDFSPERLVMISCNPATAARDCKRLSDLGYEVIEYMPFDLFPRTNAVECVVNLKKKIV